MKNAYKTNDWYKFVLIIAMVISYIVAVMNNNVGYAALALGLTIYLLKYEGEK